MAILKHIASKNADYGEAQRYLVFQYNELTKKPILDKNGKLIPREEYLLDGLNCDPFSFDAECMELNARFHKNQKYDEIKSHHYIISFDPKDAEDNGWTGERAQQLGLEYAKKNFPGHQALVCTHMDGHNGSGNIHVHIVINSLRKYDVERQDFMERPCDSRAGNKHHLTKAYLIHLKQSVMDMCRREKLYQVDLLTPAEKKVTEKEYWAKRRGQKKVDERCQEMINSGITPRQTKFQTQKEFLRLSIDAAASSAKNTDEFKQILSEKYGITLKINRGRFSYLHPERTKAITGRNLGTHYEKDYLLQQFEENCKTSVKQKDTTYSEQDNFKTDPGSHSLDIPNDSDSFSFLFFKSDLRLVIDLQQCVKAQQSRAYAQKVRLSNLQEMARTVAYVQEHRFDTRETLEDKFSEIRTQAASSRKELKNIEGRLRDVNEQIHYTGQYLANKSVYNQFLKSKNKGKFRKEHSAEIALYEAAAKFLKEHSADGKLPSLKLLKATKAQLSEQKNTAQKKYHYYRDYQKELRTVCSNVDMILEPSQFQHRDKQKSPHIP